MSIRLKLEVSEKLTQDFPKDPNSDVALVVSKKRFELQKAFLRIESEYFKALFDSS